MSCGVADGESEYGSDYGGWYDVFDHDGPFCCAYKGIVPYFYGVVQVGIKKWPRIILGLMIKDYQTGLSLSSSHSSPNFARWRFAYSVKNF